MPNVYIDMIKHAIPAGARKFVGEHDAQYIVFGSYDLLYFAIPEQADGRAPEQAAGKQLNWLEWQHENRHDLDWNYERHPMCLYCSDAQSRQLRLVLDPQTNSTYPLVLSMVRMVKYPLLKSEPTLDDALSSLQQHLSNLLEGQPSLDVVACWNLGNADFVLLSRPQNLSQLRDLLLALGNSPFTILRADGEPSAVTKFCALSSYCAFPIDNTAVPCVNEDDLRAWLSRDETLRFVNTVDWLPNPQARSGHYGDAAFLFGDRDFQYVASHTSVDLILHMLKEMLDPERSPSILSSSLIPSLPMAGITPTGSVQTVPTYDAEWDELCKPMDLVNSALSKIRGAAEDELRELGYTPSPSKRDSESELPDQIKQLEHCRNTLCSLYWHAMRLYASAYQDDVLRVVMRLYDSLASTIDSYCRHINSQTIHNGEGRFARAIPNLYLRIMRFVSELQHVYTVLAISPHSYMETYYGSMRSLNASSKLWVSYNGVIRAICDLFPLHNDYDDQRCSVLLVPYREKRSKSTQVFPALNSSSIVVLLQLNYPMMFDATWTLFVIAHELGHYVFNTTRAQRCTLLFEAIVAGILLNKRWDDALERPLFYLFSVMRLDDKTATSELREDEERVANDPCARKWPNLDVYASLDDDTYNSLYDEMEADLAARYKGVMAQEAARSAKGFMESCAQRLANGRGSNEYHGRSVVEAIHAYLMDHSDDIVENAARGISDASVDFLQNLGSYEAKYSVRFGLFSLASAKAYWMSRKESGRGGSDAVVRYPSEPFRKWCSTILDIFRETHADVFACMVVGYSRDDYLRHISRFADSKPELIATQYDLIRIMVVCETVFEDAGCKLLMDWMRNADKCHYSELVRNTALARVRTTLEEPHYQYLLEYGRTVMVEVNRRIASIRRNKQESDLLDAVQGFASSNDETMRHLWQFWLYAMRRD